MMYSNGLTQLWLFLFTKMRLRIVTSMEISLFFFFAWSATFSQALNSFEAEVMKNGVFF